MRSMNHRSIIMIIVFCFIVSLAAGRSRAQDTVSNEDSAAREEGVPWNKDLDKKIDTTIKILKAVKEELPDKESADQAKTLGQQQTPGKEEEPAWAGKMRSVAGKTTRIWKKTRKIIKSETGETEPLADSPEEEAEIRKDVSQKLGGLIDAMKIIKEELEKPVEEESK